MRVSTVNFTLFENLKGPKVRIYSLVWQPEHFGFASATNPFIMPAISDFRNSHKRQDCSWPTHSGLN